METKILEMYDLNMLFLILTLILQVLIRSVNHNLNCIYGIFSF